MKLLKFTTTTNLDLLVLTKFGDLGVKVESGGTCYSTEVHFKALI